MTTSMPPRGPHEPDDILPGEAELKRLYGKLPQSEPGPVLDAAVLRAAAQAVSTNDDVNSAPHGAASKRRPRFPRWLIGLSSAATLVLGAGLAWHMRGMPQTGIEAATTNKTVSEKASAPERTRVTVTAAPKTTPPPPPPSQSPKQPPPKFLRPLVSGKATDMPHATLQTMGAVRRRSSNVSQQDRTATPRSVRVAPAPVAEVSDSRFSRYNKAAAASSSIHAQVESPPPRIQPQVISPTPIRLPMPADQTLPPAPIESQTAAPAGVQTDELPAQDANPEQIAELDAIRQLFAQHHQEEAQRRLANFHRLHPQQLLPADLQAHLSKP